MLVLPKGEKGNDGTDATDSPIITEDGVAIPVVAGEVNIVTPTVTQDGVSANITGTPPGARAYDVLMPKVTINSGAITPSTSGLNGLTKTYSVGIKEDGVALTPVAGVVDVITPTVTQDGQTITPSGVLPAKVYDVTTPVVKINGGAITNSGTAIAKIYSVGIKQNGVALTPSAGAVDVITPTVSYNNVAVTPTGALPAKNFNVLVKTDMIRIASTDTQVLPTTIPVNTGDLFQGDDAGETNFSTIKTSNVEQYKFPADTSVFDYDKTTGNLTINKAGYYNFNAAFHAGDYVDTLPIFGAGYVVMRIHKYLSGLITQEGENIVFSTVHVPVQNGILTKTITGGTTYTNGSFSNVAFTGGTGTGFTANITIAGGVLTVVTIVQNGTGYTIGDVLKPDTAISGAGDGAAAITVLTLSKSNYRYLDIDCSAAGVLLTAPYVVNVQIFNKLSLPITGFKSFYFSVTRLEYNT